MRDVRMGDNVVFLPRCDRRHPLWAVVVRVGHAGSLVLNVFTEHGVQVQSCYHVDSDWHKEFREQSERRGAWDFPPAAVGDSSASEEVSLIRTLYAAHGDNVDEIAKRVRHKGLNRARVEELLLEVM